LAGTRDPWRAQWQDGSKRIDWPRLLFTGCSKRPLQGSSEGKENDFLWKYDNGSQEDLLAQLNGVEMQY